MSHIEEAKQILILLISAFSISKGVSILMHNDGWGYVVFGMEFLIVWIVMIIMGKL